MPNCTMVCRTLALAGIACVHLVVIIRSKSADLSNRKSNAEDMLNCDAQVEPLAQVTWRHLSRSCQKQNWQKWRNDG